MGFRDHRNHLRFLAQGINKILSDLMYDIGYIEKYGSGIYLENEQRTANRELTELNKKGIVKKAGSGVKFYYKLAS